MNTRGALWILVLAGGLLFATACRGVDAQERMTLTLADLPPSAGPGTTGTWQSVGWQGDLWHRFSGRLELEIEHDLGREPQLVMVYLSFAPDGAPAALAAGDLAQIVQVDASTVTLVNQTNQEFFCRIVIQ